RPPAQEVDPARRLRPPDAGDPHPSGAGPSRGAEVLRGVHRLPRDVAPALSELERTGQACSPPPGIPRPRARLPALRGSDRLGARDSPRAATALDTMRRAKIVCTLGPASLKPEVLEDMLNAGMDVARLNFSHGTHAQHSQTLSMLRTASLKVRKAVGVLGDL